jgi:hypothetical protein
MARTICGIIGGFVGWLVLWVGGEKAISAIWPAFGAHQAAFQAAIENGGEFAADSTMLLIHIVLGMIVSVVSGYLAALIAGEKKRAPFVLGFLLLALGLLKACMSWPYVPIWYHVGFTAILLPMALIGGKLRTTQP